MYAGQPPSQQPFPSGTPAPASNGAQVSYVLRVHAASEADHRGMLLVEEFKVMPDGATYVKQHRVPPNAVTPFVQQFAQQHPNVRVQQAGGSGESASQAPSQPQQPPLMQGHNVPGSSPFSTSSIGGLDGYDKYGSSYGSFAAVQAGRTGAGSGTGGVPAAIQQAARASNRGGAPLAQAGQPQPYAGC